MQAKERSPFLSQKMTRRQFISSLALLGLFGASVEGTYWSTRNVFETVSRSDFMKGFNLIDQEEFNDLVGSIEQRELLVTGGSFVVENEPANVFVNVRGTPDPSISLSVFEMHVDDDEERVPLIQSDDKKYIVPLIQSEEVYDTTISLGKLEAGSHKFSLQPTKYTKEIPQYVTTRAYTLSSSNLVMQTILDLVPKLSPRDDVYKYQHIPNDLPLSVYAKIRKNKDGVYLVAYSFIASSEDGGSSPSRLLRGQGRTPDVEWMYMQKIDGDGGQLGRIFQAEHHQAGSMLSSLPAEFHVSTKNNMVAPHLEGEKIISLLPQFLPGYLSGNDLISRYNALQVLSYRELLYERRMKLDDFSIQQFIRDHLNGINLLTFDLPWPPSVG